MIPLEEVRAARPPTPPLQARHRRGSPAAAGLLETRLVETGAAATTSGGGGVAGGILKNREIMKSNPSNHL